MYRWVLYPLGKFFLFIFLTIFGPVRVEGRKNVPLKGGLLVLANHISDADPPAVGHALPRAAYFMAKSELFKIPILGPLIRAYHAFPVNRGAPDRSAIRKTVDLLQKGEAVIMFPEGECSETGELLPILPGAALIIRTAGVKAICAGVRGTARILPYGKLIPRPAFGGVSVTFGEPREFERTASQDDILSWIESEFRRLTSP